jgi:xylulokinase
VISDAVFRHRHRNKRSQVHTISPDDGVIDFAEYKYPPPAFGLLPTEQDPESWWLGAQRVSCALLARNPAYADEVAVIGVSGHMLGCLPVDSLGNPLRPAMLHSDARAAREDTEIAAAIGRETLYRLTGNTLSAQSPLCKILWLKHREPEIYAKTARFLQSKDYLTAKLTGRIDHSDFSDGAHAELVDIEKRTYIDEVLAELSIDRQKLPALYKGTDIAGYLTQNAARALGLREGIPVIIGGGDGACANAGAGISGNEMVCCIGTTAWLSYDSPLPVRDPNMRVFNIPSLDGVHTGIFGTMQAAGRCVDWAKALFQIKDDLTFNELSSLAPVGSNGLVFLAYLEGERSPIFDFRARGVFFNINAGHRREHFCRAVFEGVAYALRSILDVHHCSIETPKIRVIGGGSNSPLWRQILADIWGVPVWTTSVLSSSVTSLGVAMAAGVGIGAYKNLEEAASAVSLLEETVPISGNAQVYDSLYDTFQKLYPSVKDLYG